MDTVESGDTLAGRVAVITGATRGIGRALALRLAASGVNIVVAGKSETPSERLPGTVHSVAEEVRALGVGGIGVRTDVRSEEDIERLIAATITEFGRLDMLINNAGALWWEPILDTPTRRYDLMWQVNVRAAFLTSYYALPHMIKQQWGHIIMNSPAVTAGPHPGKAAYMTTKFGMTHIALGVAAEHRDDNVAANALWPLMPIDTAATRNWGPEKMGTIEQWRTPDIYLDAAMQILTTTPADFTGRAVTDEQVLRERGWTEERLDGYWLTGRRPESPLWLDGRATASAGGSAIPVW